MQAVATPWIPKVYALNNGSIIEAREIYITF